MFVSDSENSEETCVKESIFQKVEGCSSGNVPKSIYDEVIYMKVLLSEILNSSQNASYHTYRCMFIGAL